MTKLPRYILEPVMTLQCVTSVTSKKKIHSPFLLKTKKDSQGAILLLLRKKNIGWVSTTMSECYKGISTSLIKDDYVHEVCRYGAAEPHAMAALVGGCAAHEAIKLLTKQYVPVDNLFLFNSMTMNTVTLKIA